MLLELNRLPSIPAPLPTGSVNTSTVHVLMRIVSQEPASPARQLGASSHHGPSGLAEQHSAHHPGPYPFLFPPLCAQVQVREKGPF